MIGKVQYMYIYIYIYILVGGFKHLLFSIIYGIILPIDYFSRWLEPPTRYNTMDLIYVKGPSKYTMDFGILWGLGG